MKMQAESIYVRTYMYIHMYMYLYVHVGVTRVGVHDGPTVSVRCD